MTTDRVGRKYTHVVPTPYRWEKDNKIITAVLNVGRHFKNQSF